MNDEINNFDRRIDDAQPLFQFWKGVLKELVVKLHNKLLLARHRPRLFGAAAHVFTMSEFARRSAIEDYGCDPARVTAVGAGANTTFIVAVQGLRLLVMVLLAPAAVRLLVGRPAKVAAQMLDVK